MLEAYLDESGIHDGAAFCVVAGYFGHRNHWRHFEVAWKCALGEFGLSLADFHTKDLLKSKAKRPLLFKLAKIVGNYPIYPVSMGIVVGDFNSLTLEQRKWLTGATLRKGEVRSSGSPNKPYYVPFLMCLMRITTYAKPGSRVRFFFGLDRTFADYAGKLYAQIKTGEKNPRSEWRTKWALGDIDFPMAKETPQLQAADLLTHLTYLHMVERHKEQAWAVLPNPGGLLAMSLKNSRSKWDHAFQEKTALTATLQKTCLADTNLIDNPVRAV
jgi:hypothetical protein